MKGDRQVRPRWSSADGSDWTGYVVLRNGTGVLAGRAIEYVDRDVENGRTVEQELQQLKEKRE